MESVEEVCIYSRLHFSNQREDKVDNFYTGCITSKIDKDLLHSFCPQCIRFLFSNFLIHCLKSNKEISFFRRKKWLEYIVCAILIIISILSISKEKL